MSNDGVPNGEKEKEKLNKYANVIYREWARNKMQSFDGWKMQQKVKEKNLNWKQRTR